MFKWKSQKRVLQPRTAYGEWLLSHVLNDGREVDTSACSAMEQFTIHQAVFEVAIRRRFPSGTPLPTLTEFVMYIHDRAKMRSPIDDIVPIEAEALVRAALGDDVDTTGISPDSRMWFEGLALLLVANDLALSRNDVAAMIVEGEGLARARGYRLQ